MGLLPRASWKPPETQNTRLTTCIGLVKGGRLTDPPTLDMATTPDRAFSVRLSDWEVDGSRENIGVASLRVKI